MMYEEQKMKWEELKMHFVTPTKLLELILKYDPANPKAIGIANSLELHQQCAQKTHAKRLLDGGEHWRKNVNNPPKSNSQL
jgi:hypothetical protein